MSVNKQEGWDLISKEGDGIAAPKTVTAWAVEVNGEISPYDVVRTRAVAREIRNDTEGWGVKNCHVRKVELRVVAGR